DREVVVGELALDQPVHLRRTHRSAVEAEVVAVLPIEELRLLVGVLRHARVEGAPDRPRDEEPDHEGTEQHEHQLSVPHQRSIPIRTAPATISTAPTRSLRPTSSLRRSSRTENATPHRVSVATSGETTDTRAR